MKNHKAHTRAFIAVSLPDFVKAFLFELQTDLKKARIRASWPRPDTMHLTLKFLGDILPDQIPGIQKCMTESARVIKDPITLSASGIGVFPSVKNTRIVWCGTQGQTHHLEKLALQLNSSLNDCFGLPMEKKRFSPHLTLARTKQKIPPRKMIGLMQALSGRHSEDFNISFIKLYKSKLTSSGAVHTEIFSASIGK